MLLVPMQYFLICHRFAANPIEVFLYFYICNSEDSMSDCPYLAFYL